MTRTYCNLQLEVRSHPTNKLTHNTHVALLPSFPEFAMVMDVIGVQTLSLRGVVREPMRVVPRTSRVYLRCTQGLPKPALEGCTDKEMRHVTLQEAAALPQLYLDISSDRDAVHLCTGLLCPKVKPQLGPRKHRELYQYYRPISEVVLGQPPPV